MFFFSNTVQAKLQTKLIDPPFIGRIDRPIPPAKRGRVSALGSYWYAECYGLHCKRTILEGQEVLVVGQRGHTLLVMPMDSEELDDYRG